MANYTTSADLITDIIFRAGEPASGSDFADAALRYLNRAYQGLWNGGAELDPSVQQVWWWLRKSGRGSIIMKPPEITGGPAAVTNNSATVGLTNGPTQDLDGWYFKVASHPDVFRISAHTSGNPSFTLDSVYTGPTNAALALTDYKIFNIEYDLPTDCLAVISPVRAYREGGKFIHYMDEFKMDDAWPLQEMQSGLPRNFTMVADKRVRFSHYGPPNAGELIRLDFSYTAMPTDLANDTTEPLVPRQYRKILADWALMLLFEDLQDDRVTDVATMAKAGLHAMDREHKRRMMLTDRLHAMIRTRPRGMRDGRVLRTESGHILG